MICQRRRFMTLIEAFIAIGLTLVVLSVLTFFYRYVEELNQKIDKETSKNFADLYLHTRLSNILPRALSPKDSDKGPFFFTVQSPPQNVLPGTSSLLFSFKNGVKADPRFSNDVIALLYIDNKRRLTLSIWPAPSRWELHLQPPLKKEILMEGVDQLTFEFFLPPTKEKASGTTDQQKETEQAANNVAPLSSKGEWLTSWDKKVGVLAGHDEGDPALYPRLRKKAQDLGLSDAQYCATHCLSINCDIQT